MNAKAGPCEADEQEQDRKTGDAARVPRPSSGGCRHLGRAAGRAGGTRAGRAGGRAKGFEHGPAGLCAGRDWTMVLMVNFYYKMVE